MAATSCRVRRLDDIVVQPAATLRPIGSLALAVSAMIGNSVNSFIPRISRCLGTVHLGHHDVHEHEIDVRVLTQARECLPGTVRRMT